MTWGWNFSTINPTNFRAGSGFLRIGKIKVNHVQKTQLIRYFPSNTCSLITGSLFHGLWNNPHITSYNWIGFHPPTKIPSTTKRVLFYFNCTRVEPPIWIIWHHSILDEPICLSKFQSENFRKPKKTRLDSVSSWRLLLEGGLNL